MLFLLFVFKGLGQVDIVVVQDMNFEDWQVMIQFMVEGFVECFGVDGGFFVEWSQLMCVYMVLGECDKVFVVFQDVEIVFVNKVEDLVKIKDVVVELGLVGFQGRVVVL